MTKDFCPIATVLIGVYSFINGISLSYIPKINFGAIILFFRASLLRYSRGTIESSKNCKWRIIRDDISRTSRAQALVGWVESSAKPNAFETSAR